MTDPDPVENNHEPSFEELLAQSEADTITRVTPGEKLKAVVVQKAADCVHVDIGMRSEAVIRSIEDERVSKLVPGDRLEVYVLKGGYEVEVGLDPVLGMGDISVLREAHQEENTVQGKIESTNPGGYSVNVAGVRCFCPHSQIDIKRVEDPNAWIGQIHDFLIIEFDEASKNVVLSRRKIQQQEIDRQMAKTRSLIVPGAVLKGSVRDIREFGAFVDLGGIQGLVHISELSHQRVDRVEDVLSLEQEVDVQILDVSQDDRGRDRISLSIKSLLPDPWDSLNLERGAKLTCSVAKTRDFGVFMEVKQNVLGLIPKRFLKQDGKTIEPDHYEPGTSLEVEVVDWDDKSRQITLALPGWDHELRSNLSAGSPLTARVAKIIGAGVILEGVDDPARGLLPKRLLSQSSFKQIEKDFPVGSEHRLVVEEVDEQGRFTFAPLSDRDLADRALVEQYQETDSIGHNPFASFFKEQDN